MQVCNNCGGSFRYINNLFVKCEYCGKIYSIKGDSLYEANLEELYNEALVLYKKNTEKDILSAQNLFDALGTYRDSDLKCRECSNFIRSIKVAEEEKRLEEIRRNELEKIEKKKKEEIEKKKNKIKFVAILATIIIFVLVISISSISRTNKNKKYENAIMLLSNEEYEDALAIFEKLGDFSNSAEYVTSTKNLIEQRNNAYKNGISYFDAGMYDNAISEFLKTINYLDSKEYIQKSVTMLWEEASEDFDEKKYDDAKAKLLLIPQGYNESVHANTMLAEIDAILLEQQNMNNYNQAVSAYENEQYETAQALFISLGTYSDAQSYLSTIGTMYYEQAQKYYDDRKYVECGDVISKIDESAEWSEYLLATALRESASQLYIDTIAEEAKNVCRTQGNSAMVSFINQSVCSVLTAEKAEILKDECSIEVISLASIEPYTSGTYDIDMEQSKTDTMGNVYSYALRGAMSTSDGEASNTYYIEQKYKYLNAIVAVRKKDSIGENRIGIIRIYGDGRLLWSDENIRKDTKPYNIQVDISGVTDLKIEIYGSGNLGVSGIMPMLCEPMLSE